MITLIRSRSLRCAVNFQNSFPVCFSSQPSGEIFLLRWKNFVTKRKCILEGPISILNQKIDEKKLMPDEHQQQVVSDLQKLYEQVKSYEPKSPAGGISKWLSFGKKEEKVAEIKGLYIYGSVGGGKTMLVRENPRLPGPVPQFTFFSDGHVLRLLSGV